MIKISKNVGHLINIFDGATDSDQPPASKKVYQITPSGESRCPSGPPIPPVTVRKERGQVPRRRSKRPSRKKGGVRRRCSFRALAPGTRNKGHLWSCSEVRKEAAEGNASGTAGGGRAMNDYKYCIYTASGMVYIWAICGRMRDILFKMW